MRCESVQQALPAYIGGDLRSATLHEVRSHVRGCAACSAALAPLERTSAAVSVLTHREQVPPPGLVDDILEAVHSPAGRRLVPLPPVIAGDLARVVAENRDALTNAAGAVAAIAVAGGAVWALWRSARSRVGTRTATS